MPNSYLKKLEQQMDDYFDDENRNKYIFTCPSKTFLMGEYGALKNGPALLVNTAPRFRMEFSQNHENENSVMPLWDERDPLYKYYVENEDALSDFAQDYMDPYEGKGGFGSSSAQWIFFYSFLNQFQKPLKYLFDKTQNVSQVIEKLSAEDFDFFMKMILKYRTYSEAKFPPSGYDLVSQMIGGITYINASKKALKKLEWSFKNLGFALIKNTEKVETHFHLKYIEDIDEKSITKAVEKGLLALETKNPEKFIESVKDNYKALMDQNFVGEQALAKIEKLQKAPGVLAAKGCGALGNDVFFAVINKKEEDQFKQWVLSEKQNLIATESDISTGLEVEADFSKEIISTLN